MPIIKNRHKDRPFVILDRTCIQDDRLSWRARGLLHYLLSLPADWVVSIEDLVNRAPDGKEAVYSIVKELRRVGYVRHQRERHANGKLAGAAYFVIEVPEDECNDIETWGDDNITDTEENDQTLENHDVVKSGTVEPCSATPDLYIINNIQNKQETKETAAAAAVLFNKGEFAKTGKGGNKNNNTDIHHTAHQDIPFSPKDIIITEKLTVYQQKRINDLAAHLIAKVPYLSVQEFAKQMTETVISKKHFPRCGHDFHRKLIAIQRTVLAGGWTPPIESAERALVQKQQRLGQHQRNLDTAVSELTHWQRMLDFAIKNHQQTQITFFENLIQTSKEKIRQIQNDFQQQEEA